MIKKYKSKGFTLIELLVVIAIIGLLSTLAVVALNNARSKARDAKRLSDIKSIQTALELFFADKSTYPAVTASTILGDDAHDVLCNTAVGIQADNAGCTTVYMSKVPANPSPAAAAGATYSYISTGADNKTLCAPPGPCKGYQIIFALEETTSGLTGAVKLYATPSGVSIYP